MIRVGKMITKKSAPYTHFMGAVALAMGDRGEGPAGGGMAIMLPWVLMFGVIYLLLIRPAQRRQRDQKQMLENLQKGDEIVTRGGIIGKIVAITDRVVVIRVSGNTKLELERSAVEGLRVKSKKEKDDKEKEEAVGDRGRAS